MSKLIIVINAGHGANTSGKRVPAYLDPYQTREWWLNDRIADKVQAALSNFDCEIIRTDDTTGKKDVALSTRVKTANKAKAAVYISIHHNAGVNGGKGGGTVVFCYPTAKYQETARKLYNHIISQTGLVGNRSTKVANGKGLYEIRNTSMECYLCELGFMDSATDFPIIMTEEYAEKAAKGILNFLVEEYSLQPLGLNTAQNTTVQKPNTSTTSTKKYTYNGVDYSLVFDPVYYSNKYPDLKKAFGSNTTKLLSHFIIYGINEGRQAKATFNVKVYKENNADLIRAFGENDGYKPYVIHYLEYGYKEKRKAY